MSVRAISWITQKDRRVSLAIWKSKQHVLDALGIDLEDIGAHNTIVEKGGYRWQYHAEKVLEGEVWRDIRITSQLATGVSSMGRVMLFTCITEGIVKVNKTTGVIHRRRVVFPIVGSRVPRNEPVDRLICRAFHGPPPPDKLFVEHIDGNIDNNRADNLRWSNTVSVTRMQMDKKRLREEEGLRIVAEDGDAVPTTDDE